MNLKAKLQLKCYIVREPYKQCTLYINGNNMVTMEEKELKQLCVVRREGNRHSSNHLLLLYVCKRRLFFIRFVIH